MNLRRGFVLASIFLVLLSVATGLEFGATTSASDGTVSTTSVGYATTKDDSADQHVQLNTGDGTLSNAYVGTGSLAWGISSISNSAYGTYADVERQITGTAGQTFWCYDWGTSRPGTGQVAAWVNLDAQNAKYIYGQSYAKNNYGYTQNIAKVDSGSELASSISNYKATATATPTSSTSSQSANLASGKTVSFDVYASNNQGYYASSQLQATGTSSARGSVFYPSTTGTVTSTYAYNYVSDPASLGLTTSLYTLVTDKAKMYGHEGTHYSGGGEFKVQKNNYNWLQGSVSSTSTASDVTISPNTNIASTKTAYFLDPFRYEYVNMHAYVDWSKLSLDNLATKKEFAVLRYWDAAVSRTRVGQMDDYYVSAMKGHMGNNVMEITRAAESNRYIYASDFASMFTKSNAMTILSGCESFKPNSAGVRPLYEAVKNKAYISGGYDYSVSSAGNNMFMWKLFENMANGQTVGTASTNANSYVVSHLGSAHKTVLTLMPSSHTGFYLV